MPNKSLGQHWLTDRSILQQIADSAELSADDTVLEIGPGLGTLTSVLLKQASSVMAVEYDSELAAKLPKQFPGTNLQVTNQDILQFDLSQLPKGYKVAANVPYYITSKIVQKLLSAENPPSLAVLLVQKEVAERIAARPGDMSMLGLSAQVFAETSLGVKVPRQYFTPPPKVDSQVVILKLRHEPLIPEGDLPAFFRVAKAGFVAKRKKLRSSIAAGLAISKPAAEQLLSHAGIDHDKRAEDLSIEEWRRLAKDAVA